MLALFRAVTTLVLPVEGSRVVLRRARHGEDAMDQGAAARDRKVQDERYVDRDAAVSGGERARAGRHGAGAGPAHRSGAGERSGTAGEVEDEDLAGAGAGADLQPFG